MNSKIVLTMFGLSLSVVIVGCGMSKNAHRIPVTCSGPPAKADYLITARGDLLINGEKCKFRFPTNRKNITKKPKPKVQS